MKYVLNEKCIIIGVDYNSDGDDFNLVKPENVLYGRDKIIDGQYYPATRDTTYNSF